MSEEGLLGFAEDLRREVDEAVEAGDPYSDPEFTKLILDRLAEEGVLENPVFLDQDGTFGQVKYKITGYSLDEDDGRLVLITTVYKDVFPPEALSLEELRTAAERAVRFFSCSAAGLHEKIDPSKTDASELHVAYMNLEIASRSSGFWSSPMVWSVVVRYPTPTSTVYLPVSTSTAWNGCSESSAKASRARISWWI